MYRGVMNTCGNFYFTQQILQHTHTFNIHVHDEVAIFKTSIFHLKQSAIRKVIAGRAFVVADANVAEVYFIPK